MGRGGARRDVAGQPADRGLPQGLPQRACKECSDAAGRSAVHAPNDLHCLMCNAGPAVRPLRWTWTHRPAGLPGRGPQLGCVISLRVHSEAPRATHRAPFRANLAHSGPFWAVGRRKTLKMNRSIVALEGEGVIRQCALFSSNTAGDLFVRELCRTQRASSATKAYLHCRCRQMGACCRGASRSSPTRCLIGPRRAAPRRAGDCANEM